MLKALSHKLFGPAYSPQVKSHVFTPDSWVLEQYWFQNVFIYDELMFGCSQYKEYMEGFTHRLGRAITHDDKFVLWNKDVGHYSRTFAIKLDASNMYGKSSFLGKPARILGQIHTMRPNQLMKLDNLYQNGVMFKRKRIRLDVPYSLKSISGNKNGEIRHHSRNNNEYKTHSLYAWVYIGTQGYWSEQMDGSNRLCHPVKIYTNNKDIDYYYYAEKLEKKNR